MKKFIIITILSALYMAFGSCYYDMERNNPFDPGAGGGDVYCGGYGYNSSGVIIPVYWKNGTRVDLTPVPGGRQSIVNSIYVSGSDVYCGGKGYNSSGVAIPVYWKNGAIRQLTPIVPGKHSDVKSIFVVSP